MSSTSSRRLVPGSTTYGVYTFLPTHPSQLFRLTYEWTREYWMKGLQEDSVPLLPGAPRSAVDELIFESALRAERVVSMLRIAFSLLVFIRYFLFTDDLSASRTAVEVGGVCIAIGFSVWVLLRAKQGTRALMLQATIVDAVATHTLLLPNVLWPTGDFPGILSAPDMAVLVLIPVISGVRHSAGVALVAGLLNGVSIAVLVLLDREITGPTMSTGGVGTTLYGLFMLASCALSMALAASTRRLARSAAEHSLQEEAAKRGLRAILREHHDVRTLLSSASLNTDLLAAALEAGSADETEPTLVSLRGDLDELSNFVLGIRDRAFAELVDRAPPEALRIGDTLHAVVAATSARFPNVRIQIDPWEGEPAVLVAGGEVAFKTLLSNLIVNACEGGPDSESSRLQIHMETQSGRVAMIFEDDGPGFLPELLRRPPSSWPSTKQGGSGFGMALVERIIHASGGQIELANRKPRGARVTVRLRLG